MTNYRCTCNEEDETCYSCLKAQKTIEKQKTMQRRRRVTEQLTYSDKIVDVYLQGIKHNGHY